MLVVLLHLGYLFLFVKDFLSPYCTAYIRLKSNSMTAPDDSVKRISIEYFPSPDIAGYLKMTVTTGVDNKLEAIISLVTSSPFLSDAIYCCTVWD